MAAVKPALAEYRRSKFYSGPFRPIKIYVDDAGSEWRVQLQKNVKYGGGTVYGVSKCSKQVRFIELFE